MGANILCLVSWHKGCASGARYFFADVDRNFNITSMTLGKGYKWKQNIPPWRLSMENLICRLLVWRDLPFTFATSQEFHDILYAVCPGTAKLLPYCSNRIKSWIFVCFEGQKLLLKNFIWKESRRDKGKVMITLSNGRILLHSTARDKRSTTDIVVILSPRSLLKILCPRFH